ncbi:MAG: transporter substrate-binding domain-containing protein [Candidatus Izimaplasma sp.]|nr:transporter substrate-binding domain-containing protein [Candidatus Izimaplasma bacterium]
MKKRLFKLILLTFLLSFFAFFSLPKISQSVQSQDNITVYLSATEYDYPPFSVTENGEADGFSVELLEAVGAEMGFEVQFEIDYWNIIKAKLINDELDVLPLVGYTDDRDEYFDFTIPYIVMRGNIFVRESDTRIQSQDDLFGKDILVLDGDNSQEWAISIGLDDELIATSTYTEAFNLLSQGEYDAVLANGLVGQKIISDEELDNVEPVYIYDDDGVSRYKLNLEGYEQKFCFAVTEGDAELLSILNEGLAITSQNGTYDELYQKWFPFLIEDNSITIKEILTYAIPIFATIIALFSVLYVIMIRKRIRSKTNELQRIYGHNNIIIEAFKKDYKTNEGSFNHILNELCVISDTKLGILFSINDDNKITLRSHTFKNVKDKIIKENLSQILGKNKSLLTHIKNKDPVIENNVTQTSLFSSEIKENISNYIFVSVQGVHQIHVAVLFNTKGDYTSEDTKQITIMLTGLWSFIEKQDHLMQIEYISYHDSLTQLYNRRFFDEELKRLDNKRNLPITIIMGDVDGLKSVNDAYGHNKGDELLKRISNTLKQESRQNDIVARWGGDEFVMILPNTSKIESQKFIKRVQTIFKKESDDKLTLSISFGLDTKTLETQDIHNIFLKAEKNMYQNKSDSNE